MCLCKCFAGLADMVTLACPPVCNCADALHSEKLVCTHIITRVAEYFLCICMFVYARILANTLPLYTL